MTKITTPFSGGCACGAIRYESTAEPVMMLHCHCRDCQQSSGGPFLSFVIVPKEAFKLLQGSLRFHASPSEMGGKTRRGFCPDCGSPLAVKPDSVPQFVAIRTASLDDPSWFNPQVDVWTSDAHSWDQMNPALPKFEKEGVSAFYRDKNGDIYHTCSSYERGIDLMNTTYNFLDLTAKGRDENPDAPQDWVRYHDKYKGASKDCCA